MSGLSVVMCHYGDSWWVKNAITANHFLSTESVVEIVIIDNSEEGSLDLSEFKNDKISLVRIPSDLKGNRQHAASLNKLSSLNLKGFYTLILDTDIVIYDNNFFEKIETILESHDALLVYVEGSKCLTHSCFQLLKTEDLIFLDFQLGMYEFNFDTGRLIGLQLAHKGRNLNIDVAHPLGIFRTGYLYKEIGILHVTSASVRQLNNRSFLVKSKLMINLRNTMLKQIAIYIEKNGSTRSGCKRYFALLMISLKTLHQTFLLSIRQY